jgi:hypothetical protein
MELGGFEERPDRKKGAPDGYYQVCDTLTVEADSQIGICLMRHGKQVLKGLSCLVLADGVEKPLTPYVSKSQGIAPRKTSHCPRLRREAPLCPRMLDAVAAFPDSLTKENEHVRRRLHPGPLPGRDSPPMTLSR